MDGRDWEILREGQEGPGGTEWVGRLSQRAGRGTVVLPKGWEGLGCPSKGSGLFGSPPKRPGGVGSPFWRVGRGRESLQERQKGFGGPG